LVGWLCATGLGGAGPLGGVIALPGQVLGGVGQTTGRLGDNLDTTLRNVQRDIVGRPSAPQTFDHDDLGRRILRRTVIAISPSAADLQIARRLTFDVVHSENLSSLGLTVVQLRAPAEMSTPAALAALRKADPSASFDYDHIYDPSASIAARRAERSPSGGSPVNAHLAIVGMIDGGIALHHPAFDDASLTVRNVAGSGEAPATAHGTAIASLLVGSDDDFHGCLAGARLYAADVYGGKPSGGGALEIASALDWLSQNKVAVTNISLTGPDNKLLELAVKRYLAAGGVIVAAVGNAGPAAPRAYPAGYAGVIGVTSVDAHHHVQIDANRGDVSFAALGVDVRAAKPERGYASYTGTSFAAPIVAAHFALLLTVPDPSGARHALDVLRKAATAIDGEPVAAGYGYLAPPGRTTLSIAE
jgi:subtilisin family serine protease